MFFCYLAIKYIGGVEEEEEEEEEEEDMFCVNIMFIVLHTSRYVNI